MRISAILLAAVGVIALQTPLASVPLHAKFPAPEGSLKTLSSKEYAVLSHERFPGREVRIKKVEGFCDPSVNSYTGYLDVGAKHLFFYASPPLWTANSALNVTQFFESRSEPDKDDLIMWINGGPGGSSALGLFMELGPCRINENGTGTVYNPYGWNEKTNIFFLDQPVGTGYSYADFGETVDTSEDAAKDMAAFMYIFVETFSQFKGRPFHMSGESYAGRMIPVFASEIIDQNKRAVASGFAPINLKSILLGNGMTSYKDMMPSYYDMTCTNVTMYPVLDISTCVRMKRGLPRCMKMVEKDCVDELDDLGCKAALLYCADLIAAPFDASKINPHDISKRCRDDQDICYDTVPKIEKYLNQNSTRHLLGVDDSVARWVSINWKLNAGFHLNFDMQFPTPFYVANLLERGIDVLVYVGSYDWICNWVGNMHWVEEMQWTGKAEYNAVPMGTWDVAGEFAGITKKYGALVYATVDGAGHMVPYDKPVQSLAMLNRWLEKREL